MTQMEISTLLETKKQELKNAIGTACDVYSRCVGYHSNTFDWNKGKQQEFTTRNIFNVAR